MPPVNSSSRRGFLQNAAVAAIGAAGASVATRADAAPMPPPAKWDQSTDVIVAGGGAGGLVAASILAQNGKSVILLEKERTTGGSSAICGGAIALAGTDMQKARGIKDSSELLVRDLLEVGQHVNNVSLVNAYADNQLALYAWLKKIGAKFLTISEGSGQSVPRSHIVIPHDHLVLLRQTALKAGVRIMDRTPAERLVYDQQSGRIIGITGGSPAPAQIAIKANRAVVLATGGYARDKAMLALFTPPMKNTDVICGPGSTGDGLRMGWDNGAGLADVAYVKGTFGFRPNALSITTDYADVYYSGAIMVNQAGRRFVNESISYKLLGDAASAQPGGYAYQIYDTTIRALAVKDTLAPVIPPQLEAYPNAIVNANTIAELAEKIGIPPEILVQTVNDYNSNVAKGIDPLFNRTTLSSGYGKPTQIKTPPFYAFKSVTVILGTYAGITINAKAEVTDVYGEVIPQLYAVGEVTGGFHGAAYMTGSSFGKTQVFGLIAANSILA